MEQHRFDLERNVVHVVFTSRADGSLALSEDCETLAERRVAVVDLPWFALRQVHGAEVADGDQPFSTSLTTADGAVLTTPGRAVSVLTADCAPVVLVGTAGVAVVHAGWRGAVGGVIEVAAGSLRSRGSEPVATLLGPCIQPAVYAFGAEDLAPIIDRFGVGVAATTAGGAPALDLPRVVQVACERAGWPTPPRPECTSSPRYFSHRVRGDVGRQAAVAWIEDRTSGGAHR